MAWGYFDNETETKKFKLVNTMLHIWRMNSTILQNFMTYVHVTSCVFSRMSKRRR